MNVFWINKNKKIPGKLEIGLDNENIYFYSSSPRMSWKIENYQITKLDQFNLVLVGYVRFDNLFFKEQFVFDILPSIK